MFKETVTVADKYSDVVNHLIIYPKRKTNIFLFRYLSKITESS